MHDHKRKDDEVSGDAITAGQTGVMSEEKRERESSEKTAGNTTEENGPAVESKEEFGEGGYGW